jgi:lipoate-protein ligase A
VRLAEGFRLLAQEPGEGRWNMAVDEALASCAGEGLSPPTLRLYGFAPPTLSLGRFQHARELVDAKLLAEAGFTLVRRPTGGQAVLHDRELTYAVALGRRHLEPFTKREIYQFIAGLLLAGLEALGIRAQSSRAARGSPHDPDCFRSTGQYEIADQRQRKLIGSAQVLTRGWSLQHGAIPLDGSYRRIEGFLAAGAGARSGGAGARSGGAGREPAIAAFRRADPGDGRGLPSAPPGREPAIAARGESRLSPPSALGEELGREVSYAEAAEALARGARYALERLGCSLRPGELSLQERERAAALLESKYSRDEWNLQY